MKHNTYKIFLQIVLGFVLSVQTLVMAQPTPGDHGLGAGTGDDVVGGGADLNLTIGFVLVLAIVYLLYKAKDRIFGRLEILPNQIK